MSNELQEAIKAIPDDIPDPVRESLEQGLKDREHIHHQLFETMDDGEMPHRDTILATVDEALVSLSERVQALGALREAAKRTSSSAVTSNAADRAQAEFDKTLAELHQVAVAVLALAATDDDGAAEELREHVQVLKELQEAYVEVSEIG